MVRNKDRAVFCIVRQIIFALAALAAPNSSVAASVVPADLQSICVHSLRKIESSSFPEREDGISYRGFLRRIRADDTDSKIKAEAESLRLTDWALRIFITPSLQQAEVHHFKTLENPGRTGVYLVGTTPSIPDHLRPEAFAAAPAEERDAVKLGWRQAFEQSASSGVYVFEDDAVKRLDPEFVMNNLISGEMGFSNDKYVGPFLSQPGWCFPKFAGILPVYKAHKNSESVRKIRRNLLTLLANGYQIKLSSDVEAVIAGLVNMQRRSGQRNSFEDLRKQEETRKYLREGKGFSIELWSPEGKLLAGAVVQRREKDLLGEGVFAPSDEILKANPLLAKFDGIDLIRMVNWVFLKLIGNAGVEFKDVDMVTPLTASLGAVYVKRATYLSLLKDHALPRRFELRMLPVKFEELDPIRLELKRLLEAKTFDPNALKLLEPNLPGLLSSQERDFSGSPVYQRIESDPMAIAIRRRAAEQK